MNISVFDMFKIGIGPSASHTVGPMVAASRYLDVLRKNNVKNIIDQVEGVQTVKKLEFTNKIGESEGYSKLAYDINGATINEILYPSLDPSIFELKYPDNDIQGRVVTN